MKAAFIFVAVKWNWKIVTIFAVNLYMLSVVDIVKSTWMNRNENIKCFFRTMIFKNNNAGDS